MARLGDVRRALAKRLAPIAPDEVKIYPFLPDGASVPCLWIEPDRKFINYQVQNRGGGEEFFLILTFAVNRIDEESAQDALDDYLDPDGPFVDGLQGLQGDPGDDLTVLISYVHVLSAANYGTYKVGDTYYFGAQVFIKVMI